MFLRRTALAFVFLSSVSCLAYAAEEVKDPYADNLFGNWGGLRSKLADAGVDTTVEYKGDFWRNTSGGIKRGNSYMDNLDVKFALDGEKLFGLKGNKSLIYFLNNNGSKTNARQVGSAQAIDNIEVGTPTAKLYEAWTEQSFFNDKLAVLVGLHDLNSEFMAPVASANFIKPVMQVGQELAQTGQNGPSIFPNTSLAARVKFAPSESSYLSVAAFDGVPGNPDHPYATRVDYEKGDGFLWIAEAGWTPKVAGSDDAYDQLAIGAWHYTHREDDLVDVDGNGNPVRRHSQGAYLLTSCQFYTDNTAGHTLAAFFRAGVGDGDTKQVSWSYEAGLKGNGWMPTRPDSEIGIGLAQAHNGSKYMTSVSGAADRNEYSTELYYRDTLYRGVAVQPDVQYIINPGTDQTRKNATVIGMRLDVNF